MENKCSCTEACDTAKEPCCPVDHAVDMWMCASHKAWKEVHVDILKTKIMKAWGPQMEKTADAVIEAMGIEWQAMMAQSKAKTDLKQNIASVLFQTKK